MKLKEYIEQLNEFISEHPEALEMDVVYAKDDEGNGFDYAHYPPTIGLMYDDKDFVPVEELYDEKGIITDAPNAVCIN